MDLPHHEPNQVLPKKETQGWSPVLDLLPQGFLLTDPAGRFVAANPAATRLLHLTSETLLSSTVSALPWRVLDGDGAELPLARFPGATALVTRVPVAGVWLAFILPEAGQAWFLVNATPVPHGGVLVSFEPMAGLPPGPIEEATGSLIEVMAVAQDKNLALLRTLVDTIPDLVWLKDPDGIYLECNQRFEQFFGAPREAILGKTDYAFVSRELADFFREHDQRAMAAGRPTMNEEEITFAVDGHRELIEAIKTPIRSHSKDTLGVLGIGRDITGRKLAEEAQRLQKEEFETIFNLVPSQIWYKDTANRFLRVNDKVCRDLGMAREQIEGHSAEELFPEFAEAYFADDQTVFRSCRPKLGIIEQINTADGRRLWLRTSKVPVIDVRNQVVGLLAVVEDLTELKQAEETRRSLEDQLRQSQKLESLGTLAGGIAHDMNNVLGAILALASSGAEAQLSQARIGQTFETIARAATRGGEMVKRLLSFTRQSRAEVLELDLNALLREVARLLERTTLSRHRLELELAPDLGPTRGDASALTHAFINLCVNAVDAMPQQGRLTLRTRKAAPDWIEVMVEDTGTGMPQEVLDRALDPFFTTKEQGKGTGLGLTMVHRTVKAHFGQMEIRSQPGEGTCVTLRLPSYDPMQPGNGPVEAGRPEGPERILKLLAVDDDEMFTLSMKALVEALGHTLTVATSGEAALALLEAGLQPDVVILDMDMPGLGGSGTLPLLRTLRPMLPVLLATGRADQTAMDLVAADPKTILLSKPFSLEELRRHLRRCVLPASQPPIPHLPPST